MAVPALPPGFEYEEAPRRGAKRQRVDVPPLPPGFEDEEDEPVRAVAPAPLAAPVGTARDGDTFGLTSGINARLSGVDAFELEQAGRLPDGSGVPLGDQSRSFLDGQITPQSAVQDTGSRSYGRPVVIARNGEQDIGLSSVDAGLSVPTPKYLADDPVRLDSYLDTQRDAIAAERGAYAGQYQLPSDYRHQGAAAPMRGKIPMTAQQSKEYLALLHDPKTTEAGLSGWIQAQGHAATNVGNILAFMGRNPKAKAATYFQQQDVQGAPVLPDGPGIVTRALGALNEGIPDTLGAPVDIVNAGMGAIGLPVSDRPFLGSEMIRGGMNDLGIGQVDEGYAPRSTPEAYLQSAARGVGQSILPAAGMIGAGGRLAMAAPNALMAASPVRQAGRTLLAEAAARPGVALAGEVGAGVGAGAGGQAARDAFPGNQWADLAGQVVGGLGGGLAAGTAAARGGPRVRAPAASNDHPPLPEGFVFEDGVAPVARTEPHGGNAPANAVAAMDNGITDASISAPVRIPDRIDIADLPPIPEGFTLEERTLGRARPMSERASPEDMATLARTVNPEDVTPIPANAIESLDEAVRANPGSVQDLIAPNERDALPSYRLKEGGPARRDPIDLIGWLRTKGGIRDHRGELESLGIDNTARPIEFAKSEGFLGKLIDQRQGMGLDDAAEAAWEAGFFPDHVERPTVAEFLDALGETNRGGPARVFHPDDFSTIDAFNAARTQRGAVETAAQEGRPLAEDVGRPIDMADLDANQPPATAYEDLPALGGKVGNIAVDKLATAGDIRRALQTVDNRFGGFDAAKRGKITQAETEALANELNMRPEDLIKRKVGQALNAEQALAARQILAKSGDELVKLAKSSVGGTDEQLAAFRTAMLRHAAIQEQVAGMTAEAGRTLSQFRMEAQGKLARGRMLKAILDSGGGRESLEDAAAKIIDLQGDPGAANKFIRDLGKPGAWDMMKELWINALLSGPRTHATNIASNMMTGIWSLPEHAATAAIGAVTRSPDRMILRDVGARAVGMMEGAKEGLKLARRAFVTGEPTDGVSQVEANKYRAIPGKLGEVVRIPTRALMAEDEFFKSVAYRGEINALAAREAYKTHPSRRAARYAELRDNPTDEMMDKAVKAAQYMTFQQPLTGAGRHIQILSNMGPMKLVIPFVRTPLNLVKFALVRSPLAPLRHEFRDAIKAGGMQRDQALARVAMGSGLAALAVTWVLEGKLTGGGPADPKELAALRDTGWQPFSVKADGKYYAYQRFDPFARILSTAADFATFGDYMTPDERDNFAENLTVAIARNLSTMPTLDPAANALEALTDPERNLKRYITNLGASVAVPNIVTQINSVSDPYLRETDGLLTTIKARVPSLSEKLPARMNLWGEPIHRGDSLGPNIVSPIWRSMEKDDKTLKEVARLQVGLSKPDRKIGGVELSAEQYARFVSTAGKPAKAYLDALVASPEWEAMPGGERRLAIKEAVSDFRKIAKKRLLEEYPDLEAANDTAKERRRRGER